MQIEISHSPIFILTLSSDEMTMLKDILREVVKSNETILDIDSGERAWAEHFIKSVVGF